MLLAVDFGKGVSQAWTSVATFVPKLVAFLVILLIGWIIAKALAKAVDLVLHKIGFEKLIERGGLKQALEKSPLTATGLICKLVYYAILLIALQIAFSVFGPNPISVLLKGVVAFIPKAIVAIIIIVIIAAIANAAKTLITGVLSGTSYGRTLANIAYVFILALGIIAALNQIGVAVSVTVPVLVTVLGTIGGILVVGVGGGLIKPMQERWERWLSGAERESSEARERVRRTGGAGSAGGTGSAGGPGGYGDIGPSGGASV
ncbi:hypothetical protein C3486_33300 [Streptomyces sp. Ru73]|nr:hypothetical protein C3486_33300 [Streptomyces sp. Ru73]